MNLTASQASALRLIVGAVVDTVKESGPMGAPAGVLYAAMMHHGASYSQFESLMAALERAGKVRLDRDTSCYVAL